MTAPLAKAILVRLKRSRASGKDADADVPAGRQTARSRCSSTRRRCKITRQNNIDHGRLHDEDQPAAEPVGRSRPH